MMNIKDDNTKIVKKEYITVREALKRVLNNIEISKITKNPHMYIHYKEFIRKYYPLRNTNLTFIDKK